MSNRGWVAPVLPLVIGVGIALLPHPPGLQQHAWYFLAIFAAVIAGLITEPIPSPAVGFVGVVLAGLAAQWVLFSPEQLAQPGFNPTAAAVSWALSGFSNGTVWLIFAAFIFSLGYERTGLGRRLALLLVSRLGGRTLSLGYAVMIADGVLAPFTPSNTARSGGTIFPIVKNLPPLYDSRPNDPSARRIGSYLMWTAIASTCVTSSLFLTALAPNLLAVELVRRTTQISLSWTSWFVGFLPVGAILLLATPWLAYKLYPPEVQRSPEVQAWARAELKNLGPLSGREIMLAALVVLALALWIFGTRIMDPTMAALLVVALLVLTGTITWNDVVTDKPAWNTLVWFGTLVTLAGGLAQVGVVRWIAGLLGGALEGLPVVPAMAALVLAFFLLHYLFASVTAHVTALLPVMLTVAAAIPGMPMERMALMLCLSLGIMGIISPYGTGPSPIYAGSGFLPVKDFWRLGTIFGAINLIVFLVVGLPWLMLVK
ncbi:DASS family sodium-coupled anion symporter [Roseomonas gilardii]|uniref:Anion permease n=1 Tax=Roseomonas gilardii TaxID=257708 RepID=A0A1L7AF95_9PROT|nr:DASS family sodium-coupled anion symporter [Roseomonas gilardii]APT57474.1 anion permease [Roseomonas gilardii]MDT8330613.1 DASS family sodium-coupled anion symporter [Roseomonas gilardii]PZR18012.1 MAG: anion permease [Azospirillum brasilense]